MWNEAIMISGMVRSIQTVGSMRRSIKWVLFSLFGCHKAPYILHTRSLTCIPFTLFRPSVSRSHLIYHRLSLSPYYFGCFLSRFIFFMRTFASCTYGIVSAEAQLMKNLDHSLWGWRTNGKRARLLGKKGIKMFHLGDFFSWNTRLHIGEGCAFLVNSYTFHPIAAVIAAYSAPVINKCLVLLLLFFSHCIKSAN